MESLLLDLEEELRAAAQAAVQGVVVLVWRAHPARSERYLLRAYGVVL